MVAMTSRMRASSPGLAFQVAMTTKAMGAPFRTGSAMMA
jgi:hypothetical protein